MKFLLFLCLVIRVTSACTDASNCPLGGYVYLVTGVTFTGVAGADTACATASGVIGSKAIIADVSGCSNGPCRRASVTPNVGDGQIDWPLLPSSKYVLKSNPAILFGITGANGLLKFPLPGALSCTNQASGLNTDWTTATTFTCCNWRGSSCITGTGYARVGWACHTTSNFLDGGGLTCASMSITSTLVCVAPASTTNATIASSTYVVTSTSPTQIPTTTNGNTQSGTASTTTATTTTTTAAPGNLTECLFNTQNAYYYDNAYVRNAAQINSIAFTVLAGNDVHVALSNAPYVDATGTSIWEIVLGGWSNTKSVIRSRKGGTNLVEYVGSVLQASPTSFWLSWSNDTIQIGTGLVKGQNIIMQYFSVGLTQSITKLNVATAFGSTGAWDFCPVKVFSSCSAISGGRTYDFSKMNTTFFSMETDQVSYYLKICEGITQFEQNIGQSYSIATWNSPFYSTTSNGVSIRFQNGDGCPAGPFSTQTIPRTAVLNFVCGPSTSISLVIENPVCTYTFQIVTEFMC